MILVTPKQWDDEFSISELWNSLDLSAEHMSSKVKGNFW